MDQEVIDEAIYLQMDAAYLYRMADKTRDSGNPVSEWVSIRIQNCAAHSAKMARQLMGIESD